MIFIVLYLYAEVTVMNFSEKLQILRRSKGFTQERLASELNVSSEEIYCNDEKIYECYFHGGMMK